MKSRALSLMRRGPRTILWTPPSVNVGNHFYLWLSAHAARGRGESVAVLCTDRMRPWLDAFPNAAGLIVERRDVGLRDRRDTGLRQFWGVDFDASEVESFVRDVLLDSPWGSALPAPLADAETLVVNVRRGDYYSVPAHRARYAFDQNSYLRTAVARATATGGRPDTVVVVSDDLQWCRDHLGWLGDHADRLTFAPPDSTPRTDLATLASARRLVLTNTTFGYWGAHVSNVRHGDNHGLVVAPWFHARIGDWAADQLDPRWDIVREIPGGWGSAPADFA